MLLPITIFVALTAYLPAVVSVTMVGRWAALACGAAALLCTVRRPLLGPAHVWGCLLLAWAGLSVFWSVSPLDSVGELWHWLVLGVLFLAASQCRDPESILVALICGLCVSVPFVMMQMRGFSPVEATDAPAGLFLSRNAMGEVAACALVWSLTRRAWLLMPAPLLLVAVSQSRGALLGCAVGTAAMLWRWSRWSAIVACLLTTCGVIVLSVIKDPLSASILLRLDIWRLALENVSVIGSGLETFGTLAPRLVYVHCDPLQLLLELGVVGAVLCGVLLVYCLRAGGPESAVLAAILGSASVSFPLHHPIGAALVVVLAGLLCGARLRAERAEHLLRECGATRAARESEPRADIRRARGGLALVAARQEHSLDAGDLARHVQRDGEETLV